MKAKQQKLFPKNSKLTHGGTLRTKRNGRGARPLSTKQPIHLVFKADKNCVRGGLRNSRRFALITRLIKKYSARFYIRVDKVSIQNDHIHFVIRTSWRRNYAAFFRVLAGQIAQCFQKEGLLTINVTDTPQGPTKKQKLCGNFYGADSLAESHQGCEIPAADKNVKTPACKVSKEESLRITK